MARPQFGLLALMICLTGICVWMAFGYYGLGTLGFLMAILAGLVAMVWWATTGDPQDLMVLVKVPTEAHGAIIVAALEEHGIASTTTGGFTAGGYLYVPTYATVLVKAEDYEAARKVLLELIQQASQIDWSQVDLATIERN